LAQQRDLVDRQGPVLFALGVDGDHGQGMDHGPLGGADPLQEVVLAVLVHQKPDGAAVHAVDRLSVGQRAVQRLEHEAVAADDHGRLCLIERNPVPALQKTFVSVLGALAGRSHKR